MDKTYKKGDIVYWNHYYNDYYVGLGIKMKILGHNAYNVYQATSVDDATFRTWNVFAEEIFDTKEEAIIQGKKHSEEIKESYRQKIHSVEDLLIYPLRNFYIDTEYVEPEALSAYIEKAKELLNIDLSGKELY